MFLHWNQKQVNSLLNLIEQYYEDLINVVMFLKKHHQTGMDQICGWDPPQTLKAVYGLRPTLQSPFRKKINYSEWYYVNSCSCFLERDALLILEN